MSTFIDGNLDRARALYLLTMQDSVLRGMAEQFPEPRWIKFWHDGDDIPVFVWLNHAYAKTYGLDGYRLIGHCDRMAWPDAVATEFDANDRRAIEQAGTVLVCRERTPGGPSEHVISRKFAFRIETEELRGWAIYGECTLEP